jgi:(p)ppGpp synthase/HD superfamily hydrolase
MATVINSLMTARAKADAVKAHESIAQVRKHGSAAYGRVRYYFHPLMVSELVGAVTEDEEVIAAAALHDVLEDVSPHNELFSAGWIKNAYGLRVLELVVECTNVFSKDETQRDVLSDAHSVLRSFGSSVAADMSELNFWFAESCMANRKERKKMEAERYANISEASKIIKRADLFHNASEVDPSDKFWANWLAEKALIDSLIGRWEDQSLLVASAV